MLDPTQQPTKQVAAAQPAQPSFPLTNLNITEQGMLITILLAPGLSINQMIGEETMNQIAGRWLETRREMKKNMDIIRHVKESRIN